MEYKHLQRPENMKEIRCAYHEHKVADTYSGQAFEEIIQYLQDGTFPECCKGDIEEICKLKCKVQGFVFCDGRLFKTGSMKVPRLVILDIQQHKEIIAEAHNC
ncbi:hypothetical protein DAEQUDRAFT_661945 [Daedalea quercina L-15889]|uniref:Uncharacterized protein n=1 Tax=Daedalea quercina L-15889 TaxID=1314783 RepID=A0A165TIS0_9APHY|nr:hypothetical protein DAEQUDRAFT_661945 [Daedalea quercina L-15889]